MAGQNRQIIRDTHPGDQAANLGAEITENPPLISTTALGLKKVRIWSREKKSQELVPKSKRSVRLMLISSRINLRLADSHGADDFQSSFASRMPLLLLGVVL